ncbi:MAG: DUF4236 domain-containing protein [Sediminibacterium sp.]|nr:DUF4236 domain-containing protein [Sediminibacterium sp.]
MGLYFRKSLGNGPFKLNFSKTGISYSTGVKGARINLSNRGTYVNFSKNGIYYRKKISTHNADAQNNNLQKYIPTAYEQHNITSGNIEDITDTDSQDFINELTEKSNKISYYKWFGILPLIVTAIIFLYVFFSATVQTKNFSEKAITIATNETSITLDANLFEKNPSLFWFVLLILSVVFLALINFLKKIDNRRLLVEIYYDFDEKNENVYQKLIHHFQELLNSSRVWQYLNSKETNDYKYSSGAGQTINRKPLTRISTNKTPSSNFKTNIEIPYLGLINTELYFFPERLIIKRGTQYGAIMYKNIECYEESTRFIESTSVPSDATVIDHTWRYLNKNGTPDKRFNDNHKIPICLYSEYSLSSSSGLNEKIMTSKHKGFDGFIKYISVISQLQKHISVENKSEQNSDYEYGNHVGKSNLALDPFSSNLFYKLDDYSKKLIVITDKIKLDKILTDKLLSTLVNTTMNEFIPFCVLFDLTQIVKLLSGDKITPKTLNMFFLLLIASKIILRLNFDLLALGYETISKKYLSDSMTEHVESLIELVNKPKPLDIDISNTQNGKVKSLIKFQSELSLATALQVIEHPFFAEYAEVLYNFANIIEKDKIKLGKVYELIYNTTLKKEGSKLKSEKIKKTSFNDSHLSSKNNIVDNKYVELYYKVCNKFNTNLRNIFDYACSEYQAKSDNYRFEKLMSIIAENFNLNDVLEGYKIDYCII